MNKKTFILLALLSLFIVIGLQASPEKHAITFDDFIRIKRISDPQLSPQGDLIAFVVTEMELEKSTSNSDIWIVPTEEGVPRRLTSSPSSDSSPRWSPRRSEYGYNEDGRSSGHYWYGSLQS